jgi:hypothetical protein
MQVQSYLPLVAVEGVFTKNFTNVSIILWIKEALKAVPVNYGPL